MYWKLMYVYVLDPVLSQHYEIDNEIQFLKIHFSIILCWVLILQMVSIRGGFAIIILNAFLFSYLEALCTVGYIVASFLIT
jgi:hypothetical protein